MSILVTYAVAIVIEGMLSLIFGSTTCSCTRPTSTSSLHVLGFYLPYIYLLGFALAVVAARGALPDALPDPFGRGAARLAAEPHRRRADRHRRERARARVTFGIGVAVTAAGGMVFGATNAFNPNSGYDLISRLLAIVILGGMGSIGGALAAAVLAARGRGRRRGRVVAGLVAARLLRRARRRALVRPHGLFGRAAARARSEAAASGAASPPLVLAASSLLALFPLVVHRPDA